MPNAPLDGLVAAGFQPDSLSQSKFREGNWLGPHVVSARFWAKLWYWFRAEGAGRGAVRGTARLSLPGIGAVVPAAGVAAYGSVAPAYPLMLVSGSKRTFAPV